MFCNHITIDSKCIYRKIHLKVFSVVWCSGIQVQIRQSWDRVSNPSSSSRTIMESHMAKAHWKVAFLFWRCAFSCLSFFTCTGCPTFAVMGIMCGCAMAGVEGVLAPSNIWGLSSPKAQQYQGCSWFHCPVLRSLPQQCPPVWPVILQTQPSGPHSKDDFQLE